MNKKIFTYWYLIVLALFSSCQKQVIGSESNVVVDVTNKTDLIKKYNELNQLTEGNYMIYNNSIPQAVNGSYNECWLKGTLVENSKYLIPYNIEINGTRFNQVIPGEYPKMETEIPIESSLYESVWGKQVKVKFYTEKNNIAAEGMVYCPQRIILNERSNSFPQSKELSWNSDSNNENGVVITFDGKDMKGKDITKTLVTDDDGYERVSDKILSDFSRNTFFRISIRRGNVHIFTADMEKTQIKLLLTSNSNIHINY
ncbi:MAG: hypothetical protein M9931_11825 [Chitinophagales bacterium]|nr:hypothetical protein [Chitinophagales bacterium]MCO5281723.1 hypothetical protein [Chitinophagales bacterium]HRP39879.1 hypothetical protein [Chitinophagales bacterium]